ncbi:MAG TPA: tetratricopeptide repeat protein, partial [Thermoanaerobaculia bacterium]|nr:tetratricopeptide repeat protein [Thermoanaerobaculia bacterium]
DERKRTTVGRKIAAVLVAVAAAIAVIVAVVVAITRERSSSAAPRIRSLAVLPFKPLATAQRDETLELGMADTLITRLAVIPELTVRPISAVRRYSRLEDDALAAANELDVEGVVEGSIQRSGSRMRVTVRLVRTSDGRTVWSNRFDDEAGDLFAVQDRLAEQVAHALVPALSPSRAAQMARRATADLEAYELYLKGRYWASSKPERAEEFFRRAVERDPKFAAAWAGIADTWLFRTRYRNVAPRAHVENARAAAMKAVALDPELAEAHAVLAQVYADHDWNWEGAETEYRHALELNPSSDAAHAHYAYFLLFIRRDFEGALAHSRRAMRIDPLSPIWATVHTLVLDSAGRHDEAIAVAEETLRVHPEFVPAFLHLGVAYTNGGKPRVALEKLREGLAIAPSALQLRALESWAHARAGDRREALAILRELEARGGELPAHNIALAWTALGDRDRAFAWLDRACQERIFLLRIITVHPGFAPLRDDPRYADLLRRMNLAAP